VPLDLGPLVGQARFEQARGVLMQICGYTADEAMTAICEAAQRTGTAPEDLVVRLRATPTATAGRFDLCQYPASYAASRDQPTI
jgi:hypothetical protein